MDSTVTIKPEPDDGGVSNVWQFASGEIVDLSEGDIDESSLGVDMDESVVEQLSLDVPTTREDVRQPNYRNYISYSIDSINLINYSPNPIVPVCVSDS